MLDLESIAEEFGTPTYVLDVDKAVENFLLLEEHLKCDHVIAYAYKANSEPALVKALTREGAGATVPSSFGIKLAEWAGVPPDKTVLVGPSPSPQDLKEAVRYGATISLESESEGRALRRLGGKFMVRINPGLEVGGHRSLATGAKWSKFGLPPRRALALLRELKGSLEALGFHMHIGSQIMDVKPYDMALKMMAQLLSEEQVPIIDIGGGLGVPYEDGKPFPIEEFSKIVCTFAEEMGVTVFLETGRFIVANAGYLLTRVNYVKEVDNVTWALVDAGMNDFLRVALYGARHRIIKLNGEGKLKKYKVAGPVCESADEFGEHELPEVKEGDYLAILDVGAYGFSMASRYNLRPLPAVVGVINGQVKLLRRRETFEEAIFPP